MGACYCAVVYRPISDHEIGLIIRRAISVREHQRGWWIFLAALLYSGIQDVRLHKHPVTGVEQALRLHGPLPTNQLPALLNQFLLGKETTGVVDDVTVWPRDILVRRLPVVRLWSCVDDAASPTESVQYTLRVFSCSYKYMFEPLLLHRQSGTLCKVVLRSAIVDGLPVVLQEDSRWNALAVRWADDYLRLVWPEWWKCLHTHHRGWKLSVPMDRSLRACGCACCANDG